MTQQTINIGTVANDRTGDSWRDALDKVNDNFNEIYGSGGLNNVVKVNSLADLPTPVGGVIELVVTPGVGISYIFGANTVDIGANRLTITGATVVLRGVHRTSSRITSTTTGDFITVSGGGSLASEFMVYTCANANFIDFIGNGTSTFLVLQNTVLVSAVSWGTIAGAVTTSLRIFNGLASSSAGFLWTGTLNNEINITDTRMSGWAGTAIDLGTATFDLIVIASGTRLISPGGTTILSGAASSANLKVGGRALINDVIFNGTGTALSGITTEDLQWQFGSSNVFVDGTTQNTQTDIWDVLGSSETVTIGGIGTFVAVGGTNWAATTANRFTTTTAGLITYTGLDDMVLRISAASTIEKVGGGADKVCTKIAVNGTVNDDTISCTKNADPTAVLSQALLTISNGDTIQLFVGNEDSTANIIVSESNIIISES